WSDMNLLEGGHIEGVWSAEAFSPDGTQIVYTGYNSAIGASVRVRNLVTGEERELFRKAGGVMSNCLWGRRNTPVFCGQRIVDDNPHLDIWSVPLDNPSAGRKVGSLYATRYLYRLSSDDRTLVTSNGTEWQIGADPSQKVETRDAGISFVHSDD